MNSLAPVQRARPRTQGSRFIRHAVLARPPVSLAAAPSLCCCLFLCLHVTNRASQGSSGPMTFGLCPCQLLPWIQSPSLHQWLLHQGTHPSIHPFTCPSNHSSVHPPTNHLLVHPGIHLPVHPGIHLSIHHSLVHSPVDLIHPSIHPSVHPYLSIHSPIHLSIHLSSIHVSIHHSLIYPFIHLPTCHTISPSTHISMHPPIHLLSFRHSLFWAPET